MRVRLHSQVPSRRRLLALAGGLAAWAVIAPAWLRGHPVAWAAEDPPVNRIGADEALALLVGGNARYVGGTVRSRDFAATRQALTTGQAPFAAILGCADSRVAPELAFDQSRGQLFVVRVAGNVVNDEVLASLEYSVRFLGTALIMVLGHTACGAVDAAIKAVKDGATLPGHLPILIGAIRPAVEAVKGRGGDLLANAIKANVALHAERIRTAPPILAEAVLQGKVKVVGGLYDLATGRVSLIA